MMKKRTIAAALFLLLCCFGANALAKTETNGGLSVSSENGAWTFPSIGTLTITKAGDYTISGSGCNIYVQDTTAPVSITLNSVTLNCRTGAALKTDNSAGTMLLLHGQNNITGGSSSEAALDNGTHPLKITCKDAGKHHHSCGSLTVKSLSGLSSAIGSGSNRDAANITIACGSIQAEAGVSKSIAQPVYSLDWFDYKDSYLTSSSHFNIKKNAMATLTYVKESGSLGQSFEIKVQSVGNHIDAEPLTAADTQVLCSIYGVSSPSQLSYKRRPFVLTTSTGKSVLVSMYPEEHGDDTISSNNYDGQFCLHMVNSKTHGSDEVNDDHQTILKKAKEVLVSADYAVLTEYPDTSATTYEAVKSISRGAAIGSGFGGNARNIAISGGAVTAKAYSGAAIGCGLSGKASGISISGGSITAETRAHHVNLAASIYDIHTHQSSKSDSMQGDAIGAGADSSSSGITISSDDWRIEASVSSTGFGNMTELEGSPFTGGSTDVTAQVSGFQYFKTIGERIGAIDMPETGDSANLALWTCLLALSGALLALMKRLTAG